MNAKPKFRLVAGRPVTVESPQIAKARSRFSMATTESRRLFPHEAGSNWFASAERVLTRWMKKECHLNVKGAA